MRAWQQVKVRNEKLARHGQAGVTVGQSADDAKEVEIRFDAPDEDGGTNEVHQVADLEILG